MRYIAGLALSLLAGQAHAADITLVLGAKADQGDPRFSLAVNGRFVDSDTVTRPSGERFTYEVPGPVDAVSITFTNDGIPPEDDGGQPPAEGTRNLIIESVEIDGRRWTGADLRRPAACFAVADDALVLRSATTVQVPVDGAVDEPPPKKMEPPSGLPPGYSSQALVDIARQGKGASLLAVGDSLTAGAGSGDVERTYPIVAASLLGGRPVRVVARGGAPSPQIAQDLQGVAIPKDAVTLIWVGRNNYPDTQHVLDDIAAITRMLPNNRYLVLSVLRGAYCGELPGEPGALAMAQLNRTLSETYGSRFVRVGRTIGYADRADQIHLNAEGYRKIAQEVAAALRQKGW